MTLFLAVGIDHPESGEKRDRVRTEHRAYVRAHDAAIRLVGPLLDGANGQCGSMYVFEVAAEEEIRAWFEKEPFYRSGVYKELIIRPFFIGKNDLPLQGWPDAG